MLPVHSIYVGAFIGTWIGDVFYVTCVSDAKYPADLKMPGGMLEMVDEKTWEKVTQCLVREVNHETGIQILHAELVCNEEHGNHLRYWFLAHEISGRMEPGTTRKFTEQRKDGKVAEDLTAYMVPIEVFIQKLFFKQLPAFRKIMEVLARDGKFFNRYSKLINQFCTGD